MSKQLDGLRILDLTNVLAGPFCAYQLAQLGADVIKIERPGVGDLARQLGADPVLNQAGMGASFLAQNAGKRSVTLDLKKQAGKAIFRDLVASADAIIENFRPGVMERLGLGYDTLCEVKPDLVYCAISGYGADGPLRQNPAYDQIIQGMAGVMSVTGDADSAPLRVGYPVSDTMGGITAAFAVTAALLRRERTGEGDFVDVSMLESTLASMGWAVSNWLMADVRARPLGNENMTAAPSGTFRTGEGLLNIAANRQAQFESLCRLLGRDDLLSNPLFREREQRKQHREALRAEIERELARDSAARWAKMLNEHDIPAGEVLDVPTVLAHPQLCGRGFVRGLGEVAGVPRTVQVVRSGFRLRSGDPAPRTPPPRLGADTQAVLRSLGYADTAIRDYRAQGVI